MSQLPLYIPSRSRVDRQMTLRRLLDDGVTNPITIIVPASEFQEYYDVHNSDQVSVMGVDDAYSIAETRQWILKSADESGQLHIAMLDDDLRFIVRIDAENPETIALRQPVAGEIVQIIDWVQARLEFGYAHVSLSARGGNQNVFMFEKEVTRPYRIYAFNTKVFKEEGILFKPDSFDGFFSMDDFYSTIQLMALGYPNIVSFYYASDQSASNSKGGASEYRGIDQHSACAVALGNLYPEFVKVMEKETLISWNGEPRLDVRIQWQKLFGHKVAERKSEYGTSLINSLCEKYGVALDKNGVYPI